MNAAIRYGLFSGFFASFVCTLVYVYNPAIFLDFALIICFVVTIGGMILSAKDLLSTGLVGKSVEEPQNERDEVFVTFTEMLAVIFRVFLISYVLTFLFIYLLFNIYDTSLIDLVKDRNIELVLANKDSSITEELFQQRIKEIEKIDFSPRLLDIVSVQSLFRLVVGFILSMILAFSFKRDKPSYIS